MELGHGEVEHRRISPSTRRRSCMVSSSNPTEESHVDRLERGGHAEPSPRAPSPTQQQRQPGLTELGLPEDQNRSPAVMMPFPSRLTRFSTGRSRIAGPEIDDDEPQAIDGASPSSIAA
jgi:hypothetical protein